MLIFTVAILLCAVQNQGITLTKFGSSHEKFDVWPKPKSLIERPSPWQEYKVDYLAAYMRIAVAFFV